METKALIRKRVLKMRDGMTMGERCEKNRMIAERVLEHPQYRKAADILCYVSYKSEVDTLILMEHALKMGKKVYCPKVHGKEMEFYRIGTLEDLKEGYKGIREPQAMAEKLFRPEMTQGKHCLMFMPGSVFDRERNRIGYGGGYYDRYLEKHGGLMTMAICYEMQVQDKIPSDIHDRKPDMILTECHIYSQGKFFTGQNEKDAYKGIKRNPVSDRMEQ